MCILLHLLKNALTDKLGEAHLLFIHIITQINHPWFGLRCGVGDGGCKQSPWGSRFTRGLGCKILHFDISE